MPSYKCHTLGHSEKKPTKNLSGHYYYATFAPRKSNQQNHAKEENCHGGCTRHNECYQRKSTTASCVRIYKDDALIMEDNHPVTDDGTLYYNLSFYGSGAYRICLYDEDGNSYMAWLTDC